jgi:tRNA threonylcarbamoyladenosine biosynthesis protein TsaE
MMNPTIEWQLALPDEAATIQLGRPLAKVCDCPMHIYFQGEIGAGKTTLIRALLRASGIAGTIGSPTYTLVEHYQTARYLIHHFDLYRLKDAEELEYLGWRDLFASDALCLVEWPEQGQRLLPAPDVNCLLDFKETGRVIQFTGKSKLGVQMINRLKTAVHDE